MKVKIYNDKKEKHMSFEARLEGTELIGYGYNDVEAIADLKRLVKGLVDSLRHVNYDDVEHIDAFGHPIKSGAV